MMETKCLTCQVWNLEKTLKKQGELKGDKKFTWLLVHKTSMLVSQNKKNSSLTNMFGIRLITKIGENTEQSEKKKLSCGLSFATPYHFVETKIWDFKEKIHEQSCVFHKWFRQQSTRKHVKAVLNSVQQTLLGIYYTEGGTWKCVKCYINISYLVNFLPCLSCSWSL